MDIKTRIDALSEVEAKAALEWVLERDAVITKTACEIGMSLARFARSIVNYENEILDEAIGAIKEAQK